jgi:phosphoserine phosphatase
MSKTMKKVSALLLAMLMILSFMPMTQEMAYAAAKKPGKVSKLKVKVSGKKLTISWKKAKNAKKYSVAIKDNSTKLTATKSTKKTKLTVTGQWDTSYKITVKAVNGSKKGKGVSKSAKTEPNPDKVDKSELDKAEAELQKAQDDLAKLQADKDATDAQLAQAKKNLEEASKQYDKLDEAARKDLVNATELQHSDWNPEVKKALNDMIQANKGKPNKYVVFDFDNTCSIFDVEEQLAVYQLQVMAFDETVDAAKLKDILATELNKDYFEKPAPASVDYCENPDATYQDWIDDIADAFQKLLDKGYKFTPAGLSEEDQAKIQADDDWKEFATKMRAMYDCVFDSESAAVAYPWVLYWFTGMTHEEVYELAYRSHDTYRKVPSTYETWTTAGEGSRIGAVSYEWTSGTQVSENIVELMAALKNNGIDVWVCSASATDPIRAAIDVFGLHDVVTGMLAMTNKYNGVFENAYDYDTGCAWTPVAGDPTNAGWTEGTVPTKAQTQGKGKVTAIQNVCGPAYNCGPIAGFMDSTGDYNFCTEFEDLEVVCCFNRASRKVTDGGGVIAEVAVYQADTLYKGAESMYDVARTDGDTLYVLQGREENGFRGLRPKKETMRLGKSSELLFRNEDNYTQLQYMIDNKMKIADAIDLFAIKMAAGAAGNPFTFKIGFLSEFSGYHSQGAVDMGLLKHKDWNPEVKRALNDMIKAEANNGKYVVFDFDNTCSIFDVEEQLAIYQLQTMSFDETVDAAKLAEILRTELNPEYYDKPAPASGDYCANADASYNDWISDITAAFQGLLDKGYRFTPAGLDPDQQHAIQEEVEWKEFATKMRAMYDCVFDSESAAVAYPWVLYWFTGMTEDEVYQLAYNSHSFYKGEESKYVTWETDLLGSKCGPCSYEFTWGTAVSDNIVELWKALSQNGIDVWVCSASATDPIRAAIDVWGGHDYIKGMMAMTNKLDADGHYINEYDWDGGNAWLPVEGTENRGWVKDAELQKTQTQGKGKVIAIQHVLYPKYGNKGPIAGFMDSTGDYNFCTEFETLQVVCCFNRASRKVTDGGGVIAELAVYQADTLGMDYANALINGETLYVLQGREENGLRGFRPERKTLRLGKTEPLLFRGADNQTQLDKMIELNMDTKTVVDDFAIKTAADDPKYGFTFKYGFVTGQPGEGLGPKFVDPVYNPAPGVDFSGYHSQK